MIANKEPCLDSDMLADLLAGRLPPDRFADALQHVESCERCATAADAAGHELSSVWIHRVLQDTNAPSFDDEPECHAAIGNLLIQPTLNSAQPHGVLPTATLGPYRLLKWLGTGGMGSVYLAEHQRLKRMAAIKLLSREKLQQSGWLERFNREMTSIAALEHPHVVRAIDAGDDSGWHYLVMEYLDGADLSKVCRRMGEIPLQTTCELIRQAALGLSAIHAMGMIHRDIKPSNLFLTRSGTVKLLDLGLVLSGDSPLATDERLTTVGHVMGTLPYMAREQVLDASGVDWRADIYSLGATMFRLLTGRAPFGPATHLAQMIHAISNSPCPSLKTLKADAPQEIIQLVDRMLSHEPAVRPQSADEVARLLAPFCDEASPKTLIRTAIQVPDDADERLSNAMQPHPPLAVADANGGSGRSKSRWPLWIAAAGAPLAFLAGILIMIATDKGTLVIESDQPGVSVTVSQGDQVIESLRVEQDAKSLRLQSGKYRIELTGVDSDALEVSDSSVLLMRGDKQVIKIKRQSTAAIAVETGQREPTGSLYQGKSFSAWMEVLDREKDMGMLSQAMIACNLLAETDAQRSAAAKSFLLLARQWGGMFGIGSRPTEGKAPNNPSLWFMFELEENFRNLIDEPGFSAIIEELETGNERSVQACACLLDKYRGPFRMYLDQLNGTEHGRAQLVRLDIALGKRIEELKIPVSSVLSDYLVRSRVHVLDVLGSDLASEPQIVAWAQEMVAQADHVTEAQERLLDGNGRGGMRPNLDLPRVDLNQPSLDSSTSLIISRTQRGYPGKSVVLGLMLPFGRKTDSPNRVVEAFAHVAREHPEATATAIITHLKLPTLLAANWYEDSRHTEDDARSSIAKSVLMTADTDSLSVIPRLANAWISNYPMCIFSKEDLEELLVHFGKRLTREAPSQEDEQKKRRYVFALHIFSTLGLPFEMKDGVQQVDQTVCDFLVGELTSGSVEKDSTVERLPLFWTMGGPDSKELWSSEDTRFAMQSLLARYPENMIPPYTAAIGRNPYMALQMEFIPPLLEAIAAHEGGDQRSLQMSLKNMQLNYDETHVENMSRFLGSDESKSILADLDRAYQQAFEKTIADFQVRKKDTQPLLLTRWLLARHLKHDVTQEKGFVEALEKTLKASRLSLDLLLLASETLGYDAIPMQAITAAEAQISASGKCDEIKRLIQGLHASRPEEFCEYFCRYLEVRAEQIHDPNNQGEFLVGILSDLFGGLNSTCKYWYHDIIRLLQANEKTGERTNEVCRKILPYLYLIDSQVMDEWQTLLPPEP
ncbi:MAG: serine/threonine protein kinase [Planctomycetota bacterium]